MNSCFQRTCLNGVTRLRKGRLCRKRTPNHNAIRVNGKGLVPRSSITSGGYWLRSVPLNRMAARLATRETQKLAAIIRPMVSR